MLKFILKRLLYMIVTIWVIVSLTFILMHAIPGDPISVGSRKLPPQIRENLYEKYGLNKPITTQYFLYMKNFVTKFDLGESYSYPGVSVNDMIKQKAPVSGQVGAQALVFGLAVGLLLGIIAALRKGKWQDYSVMFLAILGIAVPSFVMAALFQYFFTVKFELFPTVGWGGFKFTVLPSLAMCFGTIATYARFMRSSCIEVLNQDYILTARAKGVSRNALIGKHVLRNAIMPTITMLGPQIAMIFTGTFVIESIFAVPGIGRYFVECVNARDYPVILGTTVFVAVLYIISVFVVDIMYSIIDPRIRVNGGKR